MLAIDKMPPPIHNIRVLLCDIDDTITTRGRLESTAYTALENLQNAGVWVVPVTGRCAGWCDHIARMWPVAGVVGENGAFYMRYNHKDKKMHQYSAFDSSTTAIHNQKLQDIYQKVCSAVDGVQLASDQPYRLTDLAIDFAEDVPPIPTEDVKRIAEIAIQSGAKARISSIHVNCWFGDYSKLSTSLKFLQQELNMAEHEWIDHVAFIGDSPNDATMFDYFPLSVGVANVTEFSTVDFTLPQYITKGYGGQGFAEFANIIMNNR